MKRMNGTVTLSFVEEDNKQRVIFRVVPLCTREGTTFRDAVGIFPDEGSLRVVPDKREQSTFKERMRGMGNLCVIQLTSNDGKEIGKIRQNRNYGPAQGERNQYAIYSDVIEEFAPESVFEVLEWKDGGLASQKERALTQSVLVLSNKVLYGPVSTVTAATVDIASLKPFGNDTFLLHTVELPRQGKHIIYWSPDATVNWRQKRGSLRRKNDRWQHTEEENMDIMEAPQALAAFVPQTVQKPIEEVDLPISELFPLKEAQPVREAENALPIGTKLEILDASIPFEQQISRLDQPVSESANRLSVDAPALNKEILTGRFAGTPLARDSVYMPRTVSRPEPLHHVVEQQMRARSDERAWAELRYGTFARVENPVENLLLAVDDAWQDLETRKQATAALVENEGFIQSILNELRSRGQEMNAVVAAQAYLEDIEAERLSLLVQLDLAKNAHKQYQASAIASASQKKREELEKLILEVQGLQNEKAQLEEVVRALNDQARDGLKEALANQLTGFGGVGEERVMISPVIGKHYEIQDMADGLCRHMRSSGFSLEPDEAMSLLISFSLCPGICMQGANLADAQRFAITLLEALGLENVSSTVRPGVHVEVASLLKEDERRTPTVTLQILGTDSLNLYGHKTIFLADDSMTIDQMSGMAGAHCMIRVPAFGGMKWTMAEPTWQPMEPAALSSFATICADGHALLEEGEAWFANLKSQAGLSDLMISDTVLGCMRRFVEVATRRLCGGFLGAADAAMRQWIIPHLLRREVEAEKLQVMLDSLPRSMEMMGMH